LSPESIIIFSTSSITSSPKSITLSTSFNHPLPENLPYTLTSLSLGESYNHLLPILPPSLTLLELKSNFAFDLSYLPPSLSHLKLTGWEFEPIDHIHSNITFMCTGDSFDCPIDYLPPSLTHLLLGQRFNHPGIIFNFQSIQSNSSP
jgi:hypothetical protein